VEQPLRQGGSGADVLGLALGGADMVNCLKQASEFGLRDHMRVLGIADDLTAGLLHELRRLALDRVAEGVVGGDEDVLGLALGGADMVNCLKQASEFGLRDHMRVAAPVPIGYLELPTT
jgi:ABC-type branched-subunit amino acid transport system substrate-binding protein